MSKMLNSLHKENVYEKFKNNLVKKANIDLFETNRINKEIDNYSKEFQKDFFTEKYNKIIDELNSIGCTSFIMNSEQIKALMEHSDMRILEKMSRGDW